MRKMFVVLGLSVLMLGGGAFAQEELVLNSTFSTVENCDYKTKGIFVVWWDKAFDYADEAENLLNTLMDCQNDCLNIYQMKNPPNPVAGYYYNVYIHNGNDLFPDGWAMGQGTDTNGFPFLTIPIGYTSLYNAGAQHEGFHIFQYSANSPGFAYSGDSQWYIEATANWYAALKHPDSKEEFVTASCITYNPQLPMWYTFNNKEPQDQGNWQRYCHQYGMNILINYLTDVRGISSEIIVGGFFAETEELPQEYLYKRIGPETFEELYADWAAHNVGGFEHFPPGTEKRTYDELKTYGDLNDVHPIVETYENGGTDGNWYRPKNDFVTRAWAYNVYRIHNSREGYYTFHLDGDSLGEEGALAKFKGRVVIERGDSILYKELNMNSLTDGSFSYQADSHDEEISLVIISTPICFRGNQKFSYQVKIDWSSESGTAIFPNRCKLGHSYPNPSDQESHIPYELNLDGDVVFTITDNLGRTIIHKNEGHKSAGNHILSISTEELSPGLYFYSIQAGDFLDSRTMIVK